jgi:hypothetical protein
MQLEAPTVSSSVLDKLGSTADAPPVLPHQPRPERYFVPSGTEGMADHELYGNIEAPARPVANEEEEEEEEEGENENEEEEETAQPEHSQNEDDVAEAENVAAAAPQAQAAEQQRPLSADAPPQLLPRDPLPQLFDAPQGTQFHRMHRISLSSPPTHPIGLLSLLIPPSLSLGPGAGVRQH